MLQTGTALSAAAPDYQKKLNDIIPKDWLLGQRAGVLAYSLTQFDVGRFKDEKYKAERRQCEDSLRRTLRQFLETKRHETTLSSSSLFILSQRQLRNNVSQATARTIDEWKNWHGKITRGRLDDTKSQRPSQLNASNLIAHQILHSGASARAIIQAASAFLSTNFEVVLHDQQSLERLQRAIDDIRSRTGFTYDLLLAANTISEVLFSPSQSSVLIRNALLDHILCWPILVFDGASKTSGAVSVPVAVDLHFDDAADVEFWSSHVGNGRDKVSVDGWMSHLKKASDVGKALWRSKNGNRGRLREEIQNSTTVFDFTIVEEITKTTPLRLNFGDRSMESYFAQAVLAKATGRHIGFAAAISGHIGDQRVVETKGFDLPSLDEDDEFSEISPESLTDSMLLDDSDDAINLVEEHAVLDWNFEWPQGIVDKKRFVYNSFKFNRLVLPFERVSFESDDGDHTSYVETNNCKALSSVADCVQIGGWRNTNYIRCIDIAHVMHRYRRELRSSAMGGVKNCIDLLTQTSSGVLHLPPGIDAASLASALYHINFVDRSNLENIPPSLSWTFIRMTDQESDLRFWHLVLQAIGAPNEAFSRLRASTTSEEAANLIANAMNNYSSTASLRSEQPPDLLVILAKPDLEKIDNSDEVLFKKMRPLHVTHVLDELRELNLLPVVNEQLGAMIGSTRIVFANTNTELGRHAPSLSHLDSIDAEVLRRLSLFRDGYSQQMATVLLKNMFESAHEIRVKLLQLLRRGILTYGNGRYRTRRLLENDKMWIDKQSPSALATGHFFCGLSLAPYLLKWPLPGLNISEALLPQFLREAVYHFEQCAQYAIQATSSGAKNESSLIAMKNQARLAQQRIIRFFDYPTFGVVNFLNRSRSMMPRRETYELAQELISELRELEIIIPVSALVTAANAAALFNAELMKAEADDLQIQSVGGSMNEWFDEAAQLAKNDADDQQGLLLHVLTNHAAVLHQQKGSETNVKLKEMDLQITSLLEVPRPGAFLAANWFELYGDQTEDHQASAFIYGLGMGSVPGYFGNYPRWYGARILAGDDKAELRKLLKSMDVDLLKRISAWANQQKYPKFIDSRKRKHVIKRFNAGRGFIGATLKNLMH